MNDMIPRTLKTITDSGNTNFAMDSRGVGGASHRYVTMAGPVQLGCIKFQEGPILESGVNGLAQEDLLAIVIDRLQGFQSGDFACGENGRALEALEMALGWLRQRTADRRTRGVEGINEK